MKNGSEFLNNKFSNLAQSKEVLRASDNNTSTDKSVIQSYLDRIERILKTERYTEKGQPTKNGGDLLERMLIKDFVLDVQDEDNLKKLARALYESEKRVAIERGQGGEIQELETSDSELLDKYKNAIIEKYEIQKRTLSSWLTYLRESDDYPMWFKYYVVRGLKGMGQFTRQTVERVTIKDGDEEKESIEGPSYANRTQDTIAPFPELNSESLGFVRKAIERQMEVESVIIPKVIEADILANTVLDEETERSIREKAKPEFYELARKGALKNARDRARSEYLSTHKNSIIKDFANAYPIDENRSDVLVEELSVRMHATDFAKLYAFAQVETAGSLDRESLDGSWVKYDQGSDYTLLENSLRGKGTGWCTAEGSAKGQLEHGDFYVYYTKNKIGEPTEPRIAIRMANGSIAEIRGVNTRQELEPELVDIARDKYKDLPGAEKYEKADHDMKLMTEIYKKCFSENKETGEKIYLYPYLTKEELTFLYEIDSTIESFGYDQDPRIVEARSFRDKDADALIIFDCTQDELAKAESEVSEKTKAYIGPLFTGIFTMRNIEHIATKFPEGLIRKETYTIGGKTGRELYDELKQKGFSLWGYAENMLLSEEFIPSPKGTEVTTVELSVADLGLTEGGKYEDIKKQAFALGLDLVPHDLAPEKRMTDTDTSWRIIAINTITTDGLPRLFDLYSPSVKLELSYSWDDPGCVWDADNRFVFSLSKT